MSDLLNKASLVMVPSGYKEDTVYSVIPTDGSGDLTFTRASNGTRVNSAGLVEVAPWNLLQYSEELGNGIAWQTLNSIIVTNNSTTAPNGTTTADTLTDASAGSSLVRQFDYNVVAGQTYTFSVYLKKASGSPLTRLRIEQNQAPYNNTIVDITPTNEWVRYSVTRTIEAGTSSVNYSIFPDINADDSVYAWGAMVNIGSTAKPYFPTTDRLNVPRLTYQNGGGGCPSLLLEKQSTNYARNNNNLADWGIVNSGSLTKNLNVATSPDGTTNAINLVPNTANSAKMIYDNLTLQLAGGNFTMSCYAKANGYSKFGVRESATVGYYATFNLSTGTVIDNGGNTASIESVGNGWYRCIVSVAYSGTVNLGLLPLDDSYTSGQPLSHSYTGDGTKGVLVYGPQLEVSSSYATSLISTAGVASATRVVDVCYKNSISSLIGQSSGVVFADIIPFQFFDGSYIGISDNASPFNRQIFGFEGNSGNSGTLRFYGWYGGDYGTFYAGQRYKIAMAYANNDFVIYVNGTQVVNQTSGTVTGTLSHFGFDSYVASSQNFQGQINQAALFKTRLTNAELASLTTI